MKINWSTVSKVVSDYAAAFISCLIAAYLASGANLFDLGVDGWKGVLASALAAFLPVVYVALNKKNDRYGVHPDAPAAPVPPAGE